MPKRSIEEVVSFLTNIKNPYIMLDGINDCRIYHEQENVEPCVICYVYRSEEHCKEMSRRCLSRQSNTLIFPHSYLNMTDEEIKVDALARRTKHKEYLNRKCEEELKKRNGILPINFDLELTKEAYEKLVEVIRNSDLSDTVKKTFEDNLWDTVFYNLVPRYGENHIDSRYL